MSLTADSDLNSPEWKRINSAGCSPLASAVSNPGGISTAARIFLLPTAASRSSGASSKAKRSIPRMRRASSGAFCSPISTTGADSPLAFFMTLALMPIMPNISPGMNSTGKTIDQMIVRRSLSVSRSSLA
jgi:hypothetical protein